MSKRVSYLLAVVGLVLILVVVVAAGGCHGHVIRKPYVPNHPEDFDFRRPPCEPAPRPPTAEGDVLVRYLGTSGVYIEWKGISILTDPFFSRYGLFRAAFGSVDWDEQAIRSGLEGLPLEKVRAVLVGHSHYDHIGDLPPMLGMLDPAAKIYVNSSGRNMLANCEGPELVELSALGQKWIWIEAEGGKKLPVRFMPLESSHAPHTRHFHFAQGEVSEPWPCDWTGKRLRAMKEGKSFAFIIDLMSEDLETVAFRIHFQGSASCPQPGVPRMSEIEDEALVDLAILCMPSYWLVEDYPEGVLERTGARHAMVTHYEDFFRSREKPLRFVPTLTDKRANGFLERVREEMTRGGHQAAGPDPCPCGPCSDAWTMPLPGEWIRFRARGDASP